MKITQTFFTQTKDIKDLDGGWLSPKYHLMSWALSSNLLKKYHPNLELVTDKIGKQILVDELKLPYNKVQVALDGLDFSDYPKLWLLKKLYSHTLHNEPFLYVDSDVFIFKKFENSLLNSDLIAQNEPTKSVRIYYECMIGMLDKFEYLPDFLTKEHFEHGTDTGCCTGITGGQNYNFFKSLYPKVLDFLDRNKQHLRTIQPARILNVTVEEFFFYQFARHKKQKLGLLFDQKIPSHFPGFNDFHVCPDRRSFLHLIGGNKKVFRYCDQLSKRLENDFPETYHRVLDFLDKNNIGEVKNRKPSFFRVKKELGESFVNYNENEIEPYVQDQIIPDSKKTSMLTLFQYEKEIAKLYDRFDNLKSNSESSVFKSQLGKFDEIFSEKGSLDDWEVELGILAKRVKFKIDRKFVERNDLNIFITLKELQEMYVHQEYESVLLYYYSVGDYVGEYILLSEEIIFDWLDQFGKIKLSTLFQMIDKYCQDTYKFYMKKILIENVRFFIYQNIISLKNIKNQEDNIITPAYNTSLV